MNVCGSPQAPAALPLVKKFGPIEQESALVPQPVWSFWWRKTHLDLSRTATRNCPVRSLDVTYKYKLYCNFTAN
jgi:hypothetical protein